MALESKSNCLQRHRDFFWRRERLDRMPEPTPSWNCSEQVELQKWDCSRWVLRGKIHVCHWPASATLAQVVKKSRKLPQLSQWQMPWPRWCHWASPQWDLHNDASTCIYENENGGNREKGRIGQAQGERRRGRQGVFQTKEQSWQRHRSHKPDTVSWVQTHRRQKLERAILGHPYSGSARLEQESSNVRKVSHQRQLFQQLHKKREPHNEWQNSRRQKGSNEGVPRQVPRRNCKEKISLTVWVGV